MRTKFLLQTTLLFVGLLTALISCVKPHTDQISAAEAKELADRALEKYHEMPRSTESAGLAFEIMLQAANSAPVRSKLKYANLIHAARLAIWLSYNSPGSAKSTYASEALSLCQKAVSIDNKKVEGYYFRGIARGLYAQQNRHHGRSSMSQIRKDMLTAIEKDENYDYGGPHRILGALYLRAPGPPMGIGSLRRAESHLTSAYEISGEYPGNLLFLAECSVKSNRKDRAVKLLQRLEKTMLKFGDESEQKDWKKRAKEVEILLQQNGG